MLTPQIVETMLTTHSLLIARCFNFLVRFAGMPLREYRFDLIGNPERNSRCGGKKSNVWGFLFYIEDTGVLTCPRLQISTSLLSWKASAKQWRVTSSGETRTFFYGSFKPFCQYIKTVTSRFFTLLHDAFLQAKDKNLPQPTESNNPRADWPCQRETDAFYELDTLTGGKLGLYVVYSSR